MCLQILILVVQSDSAEWLPVGKDLLQLRKESGKIIFIVSSFGENKPGNRVIMSFYCEFYAPFYCSAQLVLVFAIDRLLHEHTRI